MCLVEALGIFVHLSTDACKVSSFALMRCNRARHIDGSVWDRRMCWHVPSSFFSPDRNVNSHGVQVVPTCFGSPSPSPPRFQSSLVSSMSLLEGSWDVTCLSMVRGPSMMGTHLSVCLWHRNRGVLRKTHLIRRRKKGPFPRTNVIDTVSFGIVLS